jgi:transcriptional regulator with XRE-family HTH domain
MTFHEKLQRLTEDMHKTKVSRRAGLSPTAISVYIDKKYTPGIGIAVRIARALGVDPGWLIDDAREWPPVRMEHPGDGDHAPRPIAA